ncbi:LacI family DNA-binding transcriptional regulator [Actinoplanes rectilineatus]|uniref:LacI family DNA-binding transcriptional regulator n=1 Tax=Actinoplanes rectilineatus TaxID=113571 RepID=UPI001B8093CA|nr:LacI family DNA-binding transcriptional regulator [Actinoplanes rectilineatus]
MERDDTGVTLHDVTLHGITLHSVTLHDVAREAGVSYATASRALNGSDRTVRADNAARVRDAADRLGYTPDLSAQATARGSSSTVALVVSDIDDPYFSSIAAGVTEAATDAGLIVTMAIADRSPGLELQIVRALRGHRPRAVIIAGSRIAPAASTSAPASSASAAASAAAASASASASASDDDDTRAALIAELAAYQQAGGRVALISQDDLPFTTLAIDNTGGARQLALDLAGLGYRRFAIAHADDSIRTSHDRRLGFAAGLAEAGLPPPALLPTDFTRAGGRQAALDLIARGHGDLELVFAVNDVMAIGVMTGLRESGLLPGRDLAVAGFDDINAAVDVSPALTSVRVPLHELGRRALASALAEPPPHTTTDRASAAVSGPMSVPIPVEVILRPSTPTRRHP